MRGRMTYRTKKQRRQMVICVIGIGVMGIMLLTGIGIYRHWDKVYGWLEPLWKPFVNEKVSSQFMDDGIIGLPAENQLSVDELAADAVTGDIPEEETLDPELLCQREIQIDAVTANGRMVTGDFVDVRIRYPNGEEYIVLQKKKTTIDTSNPEKNLLYLSLKEEEMLLYSSALYDLSAYPDSRLYPVKYTAETEAGAGEEPAVNYIPHPDVLEMMWENRIITETEKSSHLMKREQIDQRIQEFSKESIARKQAEDHNGTISNEIEGVWIYE